MSIDYEFIGDDGKRHGPVSATALLKLGNEKRNRGENLVYCRADDNKWKIFNETSGAIIAAESASSEEPHAGTAAFSIPSTAIYFYIVAALAAVGTLIVFTISLKRVMEFAQFTPNGNMFMLYVAVMASLVCGLLSAGCLVGFGNIAKMAAKAEWNTRKK